MRERIISLMLAFILSLSMVPDVMITEGAGVDQSESGGNRRTVVSGRTNMSSRVPALPGTLQALINEISDGESGTVTLDKDYSENIYIPDNKDVTIDLNGHSITAVRENSEMTTLDTVVVYGTLTLIGNGSIKAGDVTNVRGVDVTSNAVFNMEGGTIEGFNLTGNGAGVQVENNGQFNMSGGTIESNTSSNYGGGVFVYDGKLISITGGNVSNNTAKYGGGLAVNLMTDGLELKGGTLSGNKAEDFGGGLYVDAKGTTEIEDITISKNTAQRGGGVYVPASGIINIESGKIENNKAELYGGGIYGTTSSKININGGSVEKNHAEIGGGIYTSYKSTVTVKDGAISQNLADTQGGGIYLAGENNGNRSTLNMEGGTINANEILAESSTRYGAGVCAAAGSVINVSGGTISNNKNAAYGGGIYSYNDTTLNISGGLISNNSVTSAGGGIYTYNCKLTMTNGEISGNSASNGGGIYADVSSTIKITETSLITGNTATNSGGGINGYAINLYVTDATISNNTAGADGGGICGNTNSRTFVLDGANIVGNTAGTSGGGVYGNSSNGTFTVKNNTVVKDNQAKSYGGGIFSVVSFTVEDAEITGNQSGLSGGGIHVSYWTAGLTLKGGKISGNYSGTAGGGIYTPLLNMSGGTVSDNTSEGAGGGIYVGYSVTGTRSHVISGGEITDNTAGTSGGGVFITGNFNTLSVSNAKITGNTAKNYGGGICVNQNAQTRLNLLSGEVHDNKTGLLGQDIGLATANNARSILSLAAPEKLTHENANPVWYDEAKYENITQSIELNTAEVGLGTATAYYGYTYDCNKDEVAKIGSVTYPTLQKAFDAIKNGTASGTEIILLKNTKETVTVAEGITATLDLNSHDVKGNGESVITVKKGANLTINDKSDEAKGKITGGTGTSVTIGTAETKAGGGIYTDGSVTLKNGSIYNNSANYGAGVYIGPNGSFTMDGGSVKSNKTGRGVTLWYSTQVLEEDTSNAKVTFTLNGGEISGNVGGISINNPKAEVTINGGSVKSNSGSINGAGANIVNGTLKMTGGEISGNTSGGNYNGGGIYASNAVLNISGGKITGNTSSGGGWNGTGGGIAAYSTKIYISDNAEISNNTASNGGAIRINSGAVYISGGKITGNKATYNVNNSTYGGGAIAATGGATLEMTGGEISGNTTASVGGGILAISNSKVTISGGKITGNSSTGSSANWAYGGGGIGVQGAVLTFTGGEITDNTALNVGGGIYVYDTAGILTMSDNAKLYNNIASGADSGNDIYLIANAKVEALLNASDMNISGISCWHEDNTEIDYTDSSEIVNTRNIAYALTATKKDFVAVARIGSVKYRTLKDAINASKEGDEIFLLKDIKESVVVNSDKDVIVNFNGYTISSVQTYGFNVNGGRLTLRDEKATDGKSDGEGTLKPSENLTVSRGVLVSNGAVFTLESGTIKDFKLTSNNSHGAGIYAADSTVNIIGGTITNCSTTGTNTSYGGGIYVTNTASGGKAFHFKMTGGSILGNKTYNGGGGICIAPNGSYENTVEITGGLVSGNSSTGNNNGCGGIRVNGYTGGENNTSVIIYGVTIENNTASISAGGLIVGTNKKVVIGKEGVETLIRNNTADNNCGGLHVSSNPAYGVEIPQVINVTVTGNTCTNTGSYNGGGGVYSYGNLYMENCTITDNISYTTGGGIRFASENNAKVTVKNTVISDNTAKGYGGGFVIGATGAGTSNQLTGSEFNFENLEIKNNTSSGAGGGICMQSGEYTVNIGSTVISGNKAAGYGGGIYSNVTGTVNLNDGVQVINNTSSSNGGGVASSTKAFNVKSGVVIDDNKSSTQGGGVYVGSGSFNVYDGAEINRNTSINYGGGISVNGATVNITGGKITENDCIGVTNNGNTGWGGGIYLEKNTNEIGSTLNMSGGEIGKNKALRNGGGIYANSSSTVNLSDNAVVKENTSSIGGGVYGYASKLNIADNAKVSENVASSNAGGLYIGENAVLNMSGGEVSNNVSKATTINPNSPVGGGGILFAYSQYATSGAGVISGGKITGNTAAFDGGGIFLGTKCNNVVVSGTAEITGNHADRYGGGVFQWRDSTLFTLENGAIYGNSAKLGQDVYAIYQSGYTANLKLIAAKDMTFSDENKEALSWLDEIKGTTIETGISGKLIRAYALTLDYKDKSKVVAVTDGKEFTSVQSAIDYIVEQELDNTEIIMVSDSHENVTVPAGINTTLNLSGHTLSGLTTAITVYGSLNIKDEPTDVTVNSNTYPKADSTGTITGHAANNGGGVLVESGGSVKMVSGQIADCTTNSGGGAAVAVTGGSFELAGGSINNNISAKGAAVYVATASAKFIMSGGEITQNRGTDGIVYNNGGKLYIYGGKICNNSVTGSGTLYNVSGTTSIAGDIDNPVLITDNTVATAGGGIYQASGTVRLLNVTISGNKTTSARNDSNITVSAGGGIYQGGGTLNIGSGTLITKNSAVRGGGIYQTNGTAGMMGGIITANTASYAGGGVAQHPTGSGIFRLMQGGVYDNRSILYSAGNDFYSKYEGADYTTSKNKPKLTVISAQQMGNVKYNVWKDDDYPSDVLEGASENSRTGVYIGTGQFLTGHIIDSNNLMLTADYYEEALEDSSVSSNFEVKTLVLQDDGDKPEAIQGMMDGTAGFDTKAKEVFAKDLLNSGDASKSDETYQFNGKEYNYILYKGRKYEQDQAVEWEAGDDSGIANSIVRTYDDVTYSLLSTLGLPDDSSQESSNKPTVYLYTEVILPCSYEEATIELSKLDMDGYTMFEEIRDGRTVQILQGYWRVTDTTQGMTIRKNVSVRVKAMKNGDTIKPVFKQWIGGNKNNEEHPTEAASKILTVSAVGRYNVTLESNSQLAYTGYFDLDTGSEASEADMNDPSKHVVYGTMLGYGVTVELYNTNQEKKLKGIELPKDTLEFDLRLRGDLFLNGNQLLDENDDPIQNAPYIWAYKGNDSSLFGMPINGTTYSMNMDWNDYDDLTKTTNFAYDAAPYNSGGGANACYSGGGWTLTANQPADTDKDTLMHFTVSGYAFDDSLNPVQNANGVSSSILKANNVKAFTAGYVQVIFPFDPQVAKTASNGGTGYVSINMQGAVSDLKIKTVSDKDPLTTDNGLATLSTYFDSDSETQEHAANEMQYGDNYVNSQTGLYVFNGGPGGDSITVTNFFAGQDCIRLASSNGSNGNASTPLGTQVYIGADVNYHSKKYRTDDKENYPNQYIPDEEFNPQTDNKVEYNYMTAMNLLQKFDGAIFKPEGTDEVVNKRYNNNGQTCSIGSGAFVINTSETKPSWDTSNTPKTQSYNLTILYAAKPDGTNWEVKDIGDGFNDGGAADMDKYREENLLYFTTLQALYDYFEAQDKTGTCVGILYEFRDCCIRTDRRITVTSRMQTSDDFDDTGKTYITTNDARIWNTYRPEYKEAFTDKTLDDLLYHFEWADHMNDEGIIGAALHVGEVLHGSDTPSTATISEFYKASDIAASKYFDGYKKTQYANGNQVPGTHNGWYSGNSILLYTLDSSINIKNTDIRRGSNDVQDTYRLSEGERLANFRIHPSVSVSSEAQSHQLVTNGTQSVAVTITLKLPKDLTYRDGSIAFDYTRSKYTEDEMSWNVDIGEVAADGTTTLVFKTYVTDISKSLPDITYSAKIGDEQHPDKDVKNGQALTTAVSICAEYEEHSQVAANTHSDAVTIKVQTEDTDGIFKDVRKILREVGDEFVYELNYSNMTEKTKDQILIADVLPYNGDSRGTEFTGGYRVTKIVVSFAGQKADDADATFNKFVTDGKQLAYLKGQTVPTEDSTGTVENKLTTEQEALFNNFENPSSDVIILNGDTDSTERTVTYDLTNQNIQVLATDTTGIALYGKFLDVKGKVTIHLDLYMTPLASGHRAEEPLKDSLIKDSKGKVQTGGNEYWNDFFYKSSSAPVSSGKVYVEVVNRSITGMVWMDQDQDGKFTASAVDQHLENIDVYLKKVEEGGTLIDALDILGNPVEAVKTDQNGKYQFDNLAPGDYMVVFKDEDNNYTVTGSDTKHPLNFDKLSVTLRNSDIQKLTDANRSLPVYSGENLSSANLYKNVSLPDKEHIITGHYVSANWNLGLYYLDLTVEKQWENMIYGIPDNTLVEFNIVGKQNVTEVYNATLTMEKNSDKVTGKYIQGGTEGSKTIIVDNSEASKYIYQWKLKDSDKILLPAENSNGKISYSVEESALKLSGNDIRKYYSISGELKLDETTKKITYAAVNSQLMGSITLVKKTGGGEALQNAGFTIYKDSRGKANATQFYGAQEGVETEDLTEYKAEQQTTSYYKVILGGDETLEKLSDAGLYNKETKELKVELEDKSTVVYKVHKDGSADRYYYYTKDKKTFTYEWIIGDSAAYEKQRDSGYIDVNGKMTVNGKSYSVRKRQVDDKTQYYLRIVVVPEESETEAVIEFFHLPLYDEEGNDIYYTVRETTTPDGFIALADFQPLTGMKLYEENGDAIAVYDYCFEVENTRRMELPLTGGSGMSTTVIIGTMLLSMGGAYLFWRMRIKKRKSRNSCS